RADNNSTEPWSEVFARFEIMHAESGASEKFSIGVGNPCDRQLISIHMPLKFCNSRLDAFLAKNRVPLLKLPLRQLPEMFRVINQISNLKFRELYSGIIRSFHPVTGHFEKYRPKQLDRLARARPILLKALAQIQRPRAHWR